MFVGRDTLVADAHAMKSGKQFVNTIEDNIRRRGAMINSSVILPKLRFPIRSNHISNWHSEPYHQN